MPNLGRHDRLGARARVPADHPAAAREGHEVEITARDYAQTLELLELHGIDTPRSAGTAAPPGCASSARAARTRGDCGASGAGASSTSRSPTARTTSRSPPRRLGSPRSTCSTTSSRSPSTTSAAGSRSAVIFPDSIPPERLRRFGVGPEKLFAYPGLKEEYYLATSSPTPASWTQLGRRPGAIVVVVSPAARRLALSPQVEPAVPEGAERARQRPRTCTRSSCRAPRPSASTCARWSCPRVIVAARRGRRAEPGRPRRPRRLGRRHDEPRGGGARHAGLHDLRRSARRRRRGADPRAAACGR